MNESACLLCLGPKDFSTFIYPNYDPNSEKYANKGNFLLFDKKYIIDKINRFTDHLVNL